MFHLNHSQREKLRERLHERARVLRAEIAEALHATAPSAELDLPDRRAEAGDDAVSDLQAGIELAGIERDAAELNAVQEALSSLDDGRYGLCADCGAPIAYERLLVQPQAQRCVRCENERERLRASPSVSAL